MAKKRKDDEFLIHPNTLPLSVAEIYHAQFIEKEDIELPKCIQCKKSFFKSQICSDNRCKKCQAYDISFNTYEWFYNQYKPDGLCSMVYFQFRDRFVHKLSDGRIIQSGFNARWINQDNHTSNMFTTGPWVIPGQTVGFIEVIRGNPITVSGRIALTEIGERADLFPPSIHQMSNGFSWLYRHMWHPPFIHQ